MKLMNILFLVPLIVAGSESQQNYSGPGEIDLNVTNEAASSSHPGGKSLAIREQGVWWDNFDDDQEKCAYADTVNTIGEKVILKSDCKQIIDYVAGRSGRWRVSGYALLDLFGTLITRGSCFFAVARVDGQDLPFEFGNIDVRYFTEQAMRMSNDPSHMATVIGTVPCENAALVEWKVGLRPTGGSSQVRTSNLEWVAVAVVAIVVAPV